MQDKVQEKKRVSKITETFAVSVLLSVSTAAVANTGAGAEWQVLNDKSVVLLKAGDYQRGIVMAQAAVFLAERLAGENHKNTATSLNNLAELYRKSGQYKFALPLYQRSLNIYDRSMVANNPNTAISLNNLALLYYDMGKYQEALPLYQQSLNIYKKTLGINHPTTKIIQQNLKDLQKKLKK